MKQRRSKCDFPTLSFSLLNSFRAVSAVSRGKNQYHSRSVLLMVSYWSSCRKPRVYEKRWCYYRGTEGEGGGRVEKKEGKERKRERDFAFAFDRNESATIKRERADDETEVEVELAVVWKRQHTRLYGGLPDNRHCAPAITRNRTRQHHAGIVRVSASILLLSRLLSRLARLSRAHPVYFVHFVPLFINPFFSHLLAYLARPLVFLSIPTRPRITARRDVSGTAGTMKLPSLVRANVGADL